MKRIYLLFAFVALLSANSVVKAQSTDLEIYHAILSDTMYYGGTTGHIIQYGFINHGPTALVQATDTILLARAYDPDGSGPQGRRVKIYLQAAGVPVGDTVWTVRDTVFWSAAPSQNPYNWCDTATAFRGTTAMTDPQPGNNFKCKTIPFISQVSVETIVAENSLKLYPNPASNNITVNYTLLNNADETTIRIRSLVGQTVYEQKIANGSAGNKQVNIDITNITNGIYIAELEANGTKVVGKFSVAK